MSGRIWDRFLTEADKQHLSAAADRRVGLGERPALVLVDLYRAVFGDRPEPLMEAIKTWPSSCGLQGWKALPHIQTLLEAARGARIPIVHVTMLEDSGMPGWFEAAHRDAPRKATEDPAAVERQRRSAEIVDEVRPAPGEVVLRKTAPSAFWGTPLSAHLNYHGVDTLFIAGESTSGCVRATVVEAAAFRYRVRVVEECVFDRHETAHAMNLFDMHQKYADVVPLTQAVDDLALYSSRPAAEAVVRQPA